MRRTFGYNSKMGGYATLVSDIPKLSEMPKLISKKKGI